MGWRLLPRDRKPRADLGEVQAQVDYETEARVPQTGWPETLGTVGDLGLAERNVALTGLLDAAGARQPAPATLALAPGMVLLLKGDDAALGALFQQVPLDRPRAAHPIEKEKPAEELRGIEAVVETRSSLIGRSASEAQLHDRFGIKLLEISRRGAPNRERMGDVRVRAEDLLVLQAGDARLADALRELGLLPLAERAVAMTDSRRKWAPLLHNAPTVLILAPVGVALAQKLGLSPDAFLMAVATGAGSDFLTPIGHQCNTLVRGPGGYRFGDYARLGLPLSAAVLIVGTPLIAFVWHLTARG